jgi:hypothetical protein
MIRSAFGCQPHAARPAIFPSHLRRFHLTIPAYHRRHSRLAHTSGSSPSFFTSHHPTHDFTRRISRRPSSGSSRPPHYHRFRESVISLSPSYLSVLKRKKRREEKKKDTPIPTSCMHASAFAFFVIFRALDKRLACFLSHHLLTPSLLVSSGYGPWVIRWNRREKEERPLL